MKTYNIYIANNGKFLGGSLYQTRATSSDAAIRKYLALYPSMADIKLVAIKYIK